jgi:hypothetical protein
LIGTFFAFPGLVNVQLSPVRLRLLRMESLLSYQARNLDKLKHKLKGGKSSKRNGERKEQYNYGGSVYLVPPNSGF